MDIPFILVAQTPCQFIINKFKYQLFTFLITGNVPVIWKLLIDIRKHAEFVCNRLILAVHNKEELDIRIKLPGAYVKNGAFEDIVSEIFIPHYANCAALMEIAYNGCIVDLPVLRADFFRQGLQFILNFQFFLLFILNLLHCLYIAPS
jgi:hypothetical protein